MPRVALADPLIADAALADIPGAVVADIPGAVVAHLAVVANLTADCTALADVLPLSNAIITGFFTVSVAVVGVPVVGVVPIGIQLIGLPALLGNARTIVVESLGLLLGLLAQPCGLSLRPCGVGLSPSSARLSLLAVRLPLTDFDFPGLCLGAQLFGLNPLLLAPALGPPA